MNTTPAYTQGYTAFHKGFLLHEVPYPAGTVNYAKWVEGFLDSIDEEIERVH